jgi:hypothetical protein
LKIHAEKCRDFNTETNIAFVDFRKACDKLNRRKLLQILANDDDPQKIKKYI